VLLYSNGYAKLGDLGCCVALPPGQLARTRSGTAAYMAPEVVAARPYGAPADM
jgi:serine/threonine protein kinase